MRVIDRYLGRTVIAAILMVTLIMVSLDAVFRLMDELGGLANNYTFYEAFIYVLTTTPGKIYEYLPFTAFIGALIGLGSLASSSELVVMQAAGISVSRLIWAVLKPLLLLAVLTQIFGEYITPSTERIAQSRKALMRYGEERSLNSEGLWNREANHFMHINVVEPNGVLLGLTVFEYGDEQNLKRSWFAKKAIYQQDYWLLSDISRTVFSADKIHTETETTAQWHAGLTPNLLRLLVLEPEQLSIRGLWQYSDYLGKQQQDNREHKLAFWQRLMQPLAIISLVVVAISAIFGPMRQVTMGFRVFVGVLIGIGFKTLQNLLGPASLVFGFAPWIAVLAPIILCFLIGYITLKRVR